jgi:GntR family transcriptional regulator, transcriptional repressor for pyruvate dehydrogenase complex
VVATTLDPIQGSTSISGQVMRAIVASIASGRLRAGDSLPAESVIASQTGAGLSSVREALATLQGLGVISVKHGSGRQVRGLTFAAITDPFIGPGLVDGQMSVNVWEVRQVLEVASVHQAIERATDEDMHAMEQAATAMADAVAKGELGVEEDGEVHRAIARASGNVLFVLLSDSIEVLTAGTRLRGLKHEGRPELAVQQHLGILHAIRERDAEKAEALMREHLSFQHQDALELLNNERGTNNPV